MKPRFEELDYRHTPIGALSLRRRYEPRLDKDLYEIKLDDEFLMSSGFTASEEALGHLGTAAAPNTRPAILVGGLGLGFTARAVLEEARVAECLVIEFLGPVIEWHRRGYLPLGAALTRDPRCRLVQGDFFALSKHPDGFDPAAPGRRFDAILVDIDHSPDAHLDARSVDFYDPAGLTALARHLAPDGVFGLWSNDPPDDAFVARLASVFPSAHAEPVTFPNHFQQRATTQSVPLARR